MCISKLVHIFFEETQRYFQRSHQKLTLPPETQLCIGQLLCFSSAWTLRGHSLSCCIALQERHHARISEYRTFPLAPLTVLKVPVLNLAVCVAAPVIIYGLNDFHTTYELSDCHDEDSAVPQYVLSLALLIGYILYRQKGSEIFSALDSED